MAFKPWNDYIQIKEIKEEDKDDTFVYTDATSKRPSSGEVIAVSKKLEDKLKPGTIIYYPQYLGVPLELEGVKYVFLREEDVICEKV